MREAERYPLLTLEREHKIAADWNERGDRAALCELVASHLRLVVKIARGFAGYKLPLSDLVAEGNVGLMRAAGKFEPSRGVRFASYATWWVRAAIQEYVLRSWSVVKIGTTESQKKLFFNLRRVKLRLAAFEQDNLALETVTAIAKELRVPEPDVVEMNWRLNGTDRSLNVKRVDEAEGEWIEFLVDNRPNQEVLVADIEESYRRRAILTAALNKLTPRERDIVIQRHLQEVPISLQELSRRYAISCERVRQIELHAISKLTTFVETARVKTPGFVESRRPRRAHASR